MALFWFVFYKSKRLFDVLLFPVFIRTFLDLRAQNDEGDQVRDGQETECDVLDGPDDVDGRDGTDETEEGKYILELLGDRASEQIIETDEAEIPLAHQGRRTEEKKTDDHEIFQRSPDGGKGMDHQDAARKSGVEYIGYAEHQTGNRADDEGVEEDLGDTGDALFDRMRNIGCGMDDRCRTLAGFVRIQPAGDALLHCDDHAAGRPTEHRTPAEGTRYDLAEYRREVGNVKKDDQ